MTDELLPCPFCGGKAIETSYNQRSCGNVKCILYQHFDLVDWNQRPLEDALRKQLATRDALIERLIEAGQIIADELDDCKVQDIEKWHNLTAEYRATVSKKENVGKESVE